MGLHAYHNFVYNKYESDYVAFNKARSDATDYLPSEYEKIADKLGNIGVSQNDYAMIKCSVYCNDFTNTTLKKTAKISRPQKQKYSEKFYAFITNLWDGLTVYRNGRYAHEKIFLFFCFIICNIFRLFE